jgi:hypothetical protein
MDHLYDMKDTLIQDWEKREALNYKGLGGSVKKGTKVVVTPLQLD